MSQKTASPTTPDAPAVPMRDPIASQLELAQARSKLFGVPRAPICIGRFTLLAHIGRGAMGEVFAAYDEQLDRKIAIKLMRAGLDVSQRASQRMLREAQILARLSHPNVVHVYEVGEHAGRVYIAMEYVRGANLGSWLARHGKLGQRVRMNVLLAQFTDIGRGLAAAHAAGLVHRDFKPDNVLVGEDGRPRVLDFGLARLLDDASDDASTDDDSADGDTVAPTPPAGQQVDRYRPINAALTERGALMGTPYYMAPEQLRGEVADARSDQFSFCVALWEALFGQRPYAGDSLAALRATIEAQQLAEPPARRHVPAALRRALARGLSPDPDQRFADMDTLLRAMASGRRRWRTYALGALLCAAVIAVSAVVLWPEDKPTPTPCAHAADDLADVWSATRAQAGRQAFLATALPHAQRTWQHVDATLSRYAQAWRAERLHTCRATHIEHTQSAKLLDQRMLCLDQHLQQLNALVAELAIPDASAIAQAGQALARLPRPEDCRDTKQLLALTPPTPAQRTNVADIRSQLAQVAARTLLGKHSQAIDLARLQVQAARLVDYPPLLAEALYQLGRVATHLGIPSEAAAGEQALHESRAQAVSAHHDRLVAEIWLELLRHAYHHDAGTDRARPWMIQAEAWIARIGHPALRARLQRQLGLQAFKASEFPAAETYLRAAIADMDKSEQVSSYTRALTVQDLGNALLRQGEHQVARTHQEQALSLVVATVGPEHPRAHEVRFDLAMVALASGDLDRAQELLDGVVDAHRSVLGPYHPLVGKAHLDRAEVARQRGDLNAARTDAQRGLAIYQRAYVDRSHIKLANAHNRIGVIAFSAGAFQAALTSYRRALAIETEHLRAGHLRIGITQLNIAEALVELKAYAQALPILDEAEAILARYQRPGANTLLTSVRAAANDAL